MLADGLTQRQIAERLQVSESRVSSAVDELRSAIVEQALERADELPPSVVERLGSTA